MESLEDAFDRQDKEAQAEKAAQWREMQQKAPGIAVMMQDMAKAFGKIKLIGIIYEKDKD